MSKEQLKAALLQLNVNKPLKVNTPREAAPSFIAPTINEPSMSTEPSTSMNPGSPPPQVQVEPATIHRSTGSRAATDQDEAVVQAKRSADKLKTGFTRVPNNLLMDMVSGDLGKNELRLLLLIARMTISFDREFVALSKSVVKLYTGMQGRAMIQAFDELETRGLIQKVTGNFKSPNRYALTVKNTGSNDPKGKRQQTNLGSENPQVQTEPRINSEPHQVQSEPTRKNTLEIYKNTLSQEPKAIQEYFAQAMTSKKRSRERRAYEELSRQFGQDEICKGLIQVRMHGLPGSGAPCHSPMAFLSVALMQVLQSQKEKSGPIISHIIAQKEQESLREKKQREELEQKLDDLATKKKEAAFIAALPDFNAQNEYISKFLENNKFIIPGSAVARQLAISQWWDELSNTQAAAARSL